MFPLSSVLVRPFADAPMGLDHSAMCPFFLAMRLRLDEHGRLECDRDDLDVRRKPADAESGEDFVAIRASPNVFSEDYVRLKRVALPVLISAPNIYWFDVVFAVGSALAGLIGLMRSGNHPMMAIFGLIFCSIGGLLLASVVARLKLGEGSISIEAAGYRDSRIGHDLIPWSACKRCWFMKDKTGRQVPGITLFMRPGVMLPPLSSTYRWALRLGPNRTQQVRYVELQGAGYTNDLVEIVCSLVKRHGGC